MKAANLAARALVCGVALAHCALAPAQPPQAPPRAPEMAAGWRGPPPNAPAGASAPRGNLRNDIENNARWNGNTARPRSPPPR
jgi:hypothetical protein